MKDIKQLKDDDLEMVTGGTGFDPEGHGMSVPVDLPWWWKQPNNNKHTVNDDPFDDPF